MTAPQLERLLAKLYRRHRPPITHVRFAIQVRGQSASPCSMADIDRRISPSVEAQPQWEAQVFGGEDPPERDQYYVLRAPSRDLIQAANLMRECI